MKSDSKYSIDFPGLRIGCSQKFLFTLRFSFDSEEKQRSLGGFLYALIYNRLDSEFNSGTNV